MEEKAQYECQQCDFFTTTNRKMKEHNSVVHEGVRYQCDECDYKTTNKGCLRQHRKGKHEGKLFYCDECHFQCKFKFKWNSGLLRHNRIHTGNTTNNIECKVCGIMLKNAQAHKIHMIKEHKEKKWLDNKIKHLKLKTHFSLDINLK